MKYNKKYIGLRLITFPLKLLFTIIWFILFAILKSFQWLKFGSEEIVFGKDTDFEKLNHIKTTDNNGNKRKN